MALSISAAPVTFQSDLQHEGNFAAEYGYFPVNNVEITPHSAWATAPAGAKWVSYKDTGVNGSVLPNDSTNPYAYFWEEFVLAKSDVYSGSIDVWADDTASVYLNGQLLGNAAPAQGSACASTAPSCVPGLNGHYLVDQSILLAGINLLVIEGFQRGGDVAGIMYSGSIDYVKSSITSVATPEPATYGLIGVGLAGLGLIRARRRT